MPKINKETQEIDLAIVGGGIVGLSMALSLMQAIQASAIASKPKVVLVDMQSENTTLQALSLEGLPFDARVSALTAASESMFAKLGLWDDITKVRACPYSEMFVWDAEGTASINFSAAEIHQTRLGHIVENRLIVAALNDALSVFASMEGLEIIRPDNLISIEKANSEEAGSAHILSLESGRCLNCKLVIAADGGNSLVRTQAEFSTKEWDYQHQAIVTTVKTERPHNFVASQCFMASGPLAFLPLSDGKPEHKEQYHSSIVWSCVPDKAESLMALNDEDFAQALGQAFEHKLGKVEQIEKRFSFPLWQKHANDYVQEGIALIGDAAHVIHPLAGQGVNLGLLDVEALTEVVVTALEKNRPYSSLPTLSRYQRQRKADNLGMMLVMEGFKRIFASDDLSVRWFRNFGLAGIDNLPLVKNHLMKKAMGV